MKKIAILLLFAAYSSLFVMNNRCTHPETASFSEEKLTFKNDSSALFRSDKRYFILVPGDTAFFIGTYSCTLIVNGIINPNLTRTDSLYFRTITLDTTSLFENYNGFIVYPQIYQMSHTFSTLAFNETIRYFTKNDTAILQIAYEDQNKRYFLPDHQQKVMPRILVMGKMGYFDTDTTNVPSNNKWYTSPIIRQPVFSSQGTITFGGVSYAPEAIAFPVSPKQNSSVPYLINGIEYKNGTFLKTELTLIGNIMENGQVVEISGTIIITRTYFTERGMIDQRIVSSIVKEYSDGTIEIKKEKSYVSRPDTARVYPDSEYP
jgi:hypothetical protein